jgi:hypothetical protein
MDGTNMLNAEQSLQIDYFGDGKYVLMIGEPFAGNESHYFSSVKDVFEWVMKNYGDTPVEMSQVAHLVLTIELGVDHDTNFSG